MLDLFDIFLSLILFILDLDLFRYSFWILAIMAIFSLTYRLIGVHYD